MAGDDGDAGAGDTEHVGHVLVGEGKDAVADAVGAEQEPSRHALLDGVTGVAAGGLGGLDELSLEITQGEVVKLFGALELPGCDG